jgi:L-alanine-DL-glutamate epimerase-like enolase superfamily enzyme
VRRMATAPSRLQIDSIGHFPAVANDCWSSVGLNSHERWDEVARIVGVTAATLRVPLHNEVTFASRSVSSRDYSVVRVETADGLVGTGVTYLNNSGGELCTDAVRKMLSPMLIGRDSLAVETLWAEMYHQCLVHGRNGVVNRAISAVDIALWDCNARASAVPLWSYLGGEDASRVGSYASGGYYMEGKTPTGLGEEVERYRAAGFNTAKIKIGAVDLKEDLERVALAREALGEDGTLLLDADHAWTDVAEARNAFERLAAYRPFFVEEPFPPDFFEAHRDLRSLGGIPIATGELEAGRWAFGRLMQSGSVDIVQPDATACGGITEFRRIAGMATALGIGVWPHWMHDIHVHLVAATPGAGMVEYFPDNTVLNFRDIISDQIAVEDGALVASGRPGLGFDVPDEAVERFALDGFGSA